MDNNKIIKAAYDGMADPGSFDFFNRQIQHLIEQDHDPDPIVVTLSHALRDNIDLDGVISTLSYYSDELGRAANAVRMLQEKRQKKQS